MADASATKKTAEPVSENEKKLIDEVDFLKKELNELKAAIKVQP